jgi:DNA helicase II / ATP-dependent DNA helicase PcrA
MNSERDWFEELAGDVLLVAPPGCGKTEQLARCAASLIGSKAVREPRQLLALTFSNKATANLRGRIRGSLTATGARSVSVTNFHGLSYRIFKSHASTLGLDPETLLPQPGWLAKHRASIADGHNVAAYALGAFIREAKGGPFDDDEVLDRLEQRGGPAAVAYEEGLREARRLDFDDALRHALRLLRNERVGHLYRCRFPIVLVDECQDLTPVQFQITEALRSEAIVYAGDEAQGIYGFAGARPSLVYEAILARNPKLVELRASYRSAPTVLRAVSAVAIELGGHELVSARPEAWAGRGHYEIRRFATTRDEAAAVLDQIDGWISNDEQASVAVISRSAWRRREIQDLARARGVPHEIWDYPIHRPRVVQLLRKHLSTALARSSARTQQVDELFLLCFESCGADDFDVIDELTEAFESLEDLIKEDTLEGIIGGLRVESDDDHPVSPGVHLLTGHVGKGQQFDHVVVIGLEEGILPDFRARTEAELREELAILHVMVSRAKESLVVTSVRDVRFDPEREWLRDPSRWLPLLEDAAS